MNPCTERSARDSSQMRSTSTLYMSTTKPPGGGLPDIVVTLPFLEIPLPLPVLFKVLGAITRNEAISYIQVDGEPEIDAIVRSIFDSDVHANATQEDMFEWIGREATREVTRDRRNKYTEHIISNELLPHMGLRIDRNYNRRKLHFVGAMVRKLLLVHIGREPCDDRDSYANKRVDASGTLMSLLMRQLFRNYLKTISVSQHRLADSGKIDTVNFGNIMTDKRITSGFKCVLRAPAPM
jgi:DNA-directed RNA polymerase subunit B